MTTHIQRPVQNYRLSLHETGQRIDNYLFTQLKGVPKNAVYRILRKGEVRVNKKRVQPQYRLHEGDQIRIPPLRIASTPQFTLSSQSQKIRILKMCLLYEDEALIIMNKPCGTAVHGGSSVHVGLIEGLRLLRPELPFLELVHRLDRDSSGILLIAKKRSVLRALHEQLRNNQIEKTYLALTHGIWPQEQCTITTPLLKRTLPTGKQRVTVHPLGKPAETHFKVVERFPQATLLSIRLITGRTHQIRVHCQSIGHPIAYDNRYGSVKHDQALAYSSLKRLFLHASTLCFIHPRTQQSLFFEAPLDPALQDSLQRLRLAHNGVSQGHQLVPARK